MPRRKSAETNRNELDVALGALVHKHSVSNILDSLARVVTSDIERCRRMYGETDKVTLKRMSQLDLIRSTAAEVRRRQ